jgi:hypothetical protein
MRGIYADKPCLARNVQVGGISGAAFEIMPDVIRHFDTAVDDLLAAVDDAIKAGLSGDALVDFMLDCAAWITACFLRIHPYLNGNGRISRLISNALLYRFGLGLNNVRLNPRPDAPYSSAGRFAMLGDYAPMKHFLASCIART